MHYQIIENLIDKKIIDEILDFFHNNEHLRVKHMGMDKLEAPWDYPVVNQLSEIIKDYVDVDKCLGDNIFKHNFPYFPHVDIDERYPIVNFLIPLYVENNTQQHFVIFDQYVTDNMPRTWTGNLKFKKEFGKNKATSFIYNDKNVNNITDNEIDEEFYLKYLDQDYRDRELFQGCSGVAVEYKPGNVIMFDSKHIHCTGKMTAEYKMGLSLRFEGSMPTNS
jgi:hypothetical protein